MHWIKRVAHDPESLAIRPPLSVIEKEENRGEETPGLPHGSGVYRLHGHHIEIDWSRELRNPPSDQSDDEEGRDGHEVHEALVGTGFLKCL